MKKLKYIVDAVVSGDVDKTKAVVRQALDKGNSPMDIIEKGVVAGLDVVGQQFSKGDIFLPEMMLSAIAAREGINIATTRIEKGQYKPRATMVLGTIKGDLHDIGKNLVAMILRARGLNIVDLGVDVNESQFISAVKEYKPEILGMSAMLTATLTGMKDVINALIEARLRDKVKVIVGGAPVTQEWASQIGADYYGPDAGSTAALMEKILAEMKL